MANNDYQKSKAELVAELQALRAEVAELRTTRSKFMWTEATFRHYLQFLDILLNTIPNPVFYMDEEGSYLGCNDIFAEKILGKPKEKIFGRSIDNFPDIITPDLAQFYHRKDTELLEKLGIQTYETQLACADGQLRSFVLSRATFTNPIGKIAGIVGVMSDITELKALKAAILQNHMELALLSRTSQEFITNLDLDQVINNVLEEARQLLDVSACSAWLVDQKTNELVCEHTTDRGSLVALGWRLTPGQGIAGWVAQYGETVIVPDTRLDARHFKEIDRRLGIEMRSILSVPLKLKDKIIGVLHAVDETPSRFNQADLRLIVSLSYSAAIAIENARLYKQAQQDAITKEVLLREVNHRVKNNLAAIIGLLYAEQAHFKDDVSDTHLDDLINRVQGLSTVHDMLSASEWQPLLLSELTEQIIHSVLQVVPLDKQVVTNISPANVFISAEEAHELALVINELATNTVKYGLHPHNDLVNIDVQITLTDNTVDLIFRDNGPGFSHDILRQNKRYYNVGLELIEGIVHGSLRGRLWLKNDRGAVIHIQFDKSRD